MPRRVVHYAARQAQLDAIEARLTHATFSALRLWTTAVRDRVCGPVVSTQLAAGDGDSTGGLAPDPEIAARMFAVWTLLVREHVAPAVATAITEVMREELEAEEEELTAAGTAVTDLVAGERAFTERFLAELPNRLADVPQSTFELLRADLARGLREGLPVRGVRDLMARTLSTSLGGSDNDWRDRAALIARTETTRTLNGGLQAAWSARNAVLRIETFKQWLSTGDERTREAHAEADGQVVGMDEDFLVGGESMAYPGDARGSTANTANCRCVLGESEDGSPIDAGERAGLRACATPDDLTWAPSATSPAGAVPAVSPIPGVVRDQDAVLAAAGGNTTMAGKAQTWSGLLAPIGVNSGDRRRLAAGGTFTHRDLPLPLMYQNATSAGHDNSVVVGRILTISIGDGPAGPGIYGTGDFLIGEQFAGDVAKAVDLVTSGLGHVSVDLADVVAELVDADGTAVDEKALMEAWDAGQDLEVYDQFQKATLIGCTMVSKPAFAQALIALDGAAPVERTPDMAAIERAEAEAVETAEVEAAADDAPAEGDDDALHLVDFDGTPIEVGDRVRATLDDEDDAPAEDKKDTEQKDAPAKPFAAEGVETAGTSSDPDGDGDNDADPAEDTDHDTVEGTVTAVSVPDDQVTVQPDDAEAAPVTVKSKLIKVLEKGDAGADVPASPSGDGGGWSPYANEAEAAAAAVAEAEGILVDAAEQVASLQAAAGVLVEFAPDAEFFANPQLSALTPMTVGPADEHGYRRVFGHVAGWKSCHIGYSRECVTPPREDDFAYFHIGEVTLADGSDLAVGNLTLGGRHADSQAAYRDAVHHYDDSGAGVAVVRAYADEFGIAVAGVITPETDELQIGQLRRSGLSGDWRRIGGELRLVGALAVNTGGFPVPRYATDGTGRVLSLVAAGSVPQALKVEESFEEVARRVFAEERQKEARRLEVASLTASATKVAEVVNRSVLDDVLAGVDLSIETDGEAA
jgi:hypothetical protein